MNFINSVIFATSGYVRSTLIIFSPMEWGAESIRELLFLHYGVLGAAHILLLLGWFSDCPQKKNGKLLYGNWEMCFSCQNPRVICHYSTTNIKNRTLTYGIELLCTEYGVYSVYIRSITASLTRWLPQKCMRVYSVPYIVRTTNPPAPMICEVAEKFRLAYYILLNFSSFNRKRFLNISWKWWFRAMNTGILV